MKVINFYGIKEDLNLESIRKLLESKDCGKKFYLTEGDLEYLVKEVKKLLYKLRGENGVTSLYELKCIVRKVLDENQFDWVQ